MSSPTAELRPPAAWFALGETIFREVLVLLARYGVRVDPALRFVQAEAPSPFYEPRSATIHFGVPDPATPKGRLYWYFVQHLVGAPDLVAAQRAIEAPLPWAVAHEVAHHLRHHYRAPTDNNFVEEHVANCIAVALVGEHPIYRVDLPALQRWAAGVAERTRTLSPATVTYLAGDRLTVDEVLVAQGMVEGATWTEAKGVAVATETTVEEVLLRSKAISRTQLDEARAQRVRTEDYFNRRYMASLSEYWLFGTEWLAAYLGRDDRPSLGEALDRHVLTRDWESSRQDATRLLLEQALRGADADVAAAAAEALGESGERSSISILVAALADPRPPVQLAALRTLGTLDGGPAAGAAGARALLTGPDGVRGAAARLLRLASVPLVLPPDPDPAQLAEQALASLADDPIAAYRLFDRLLDGEEASTLAALQALRAVGPGPLVGRVSERLETGSIRVRVAAARALTGCPGAATALVRRLDDDEEAVRLAARDGLRELAATAWPALRAGATAAPDRLRVAALCLASELGALDTAPLLDEMAAELLRRARRLARLEARLLPHPELALLAQAVGEERGRLARLSLRVLGQRIDPRARDLAERVLESPKLAHQAAGRRLVVHALGRRGPAVVRLLEAGTPGPDAGDPGSVVGAALGAEPAIVRAVAANLIPKVVPLARARRLLQRLADDPDLLVRIEAEQAAARLTSPIGAFMLTTVEKLMFLRAVPTFRAVELETLRAAAELLVAQRFATGETIIHEGEPGEHLYIVIEGRVTVSVGGEAVNELHPRQYFGEMALFDGRPRSATVTAAEDSTVLRLGREGFVRLGRRSPDLLIEVIRVLSERLRAVQAVGPAERSGRDASPLASPTTTG